MEEKMPISETIKVIEGQTIYKSEKWWSAVLLVESFGRKQIAVYVWNRRNDGWKRRQKFVISNAKHWGRVKEVVEKLLPKM